MSDERSKSVCLTPKTSFVLGLVGGVLVICTIGFFILLFALMSGGMKAKGPTGAGTGEPAVVDADPQPQPSERPSASGNVPAVSDEDRVTGGSGADVTLIVYSDIECPFCGRFHPALTQAIDEYGDDILVVFRHFPLSFHPNAAAAAHAAECAGDQGEFWAYLDVLYENQQALDADLYGELAGDLGLNTGSFTSCMESGKHEEKIAADMAGGAQGGVSGTPATVIIAADGSRSVVPGAIGFDQLKAMIDSAF